MDRYICTSYGVTIDAHSHNFGAFPGGWFTTLEKAREYAEHYRERKGVAVIINKLERLLLLDSEGNWTKP